LRHSVDNYDWDSDWFVRNAWRIIIAVTSTDSVDVGGMDLLPLTSYILCLRLSWKGLK